MNDYESLISNDAPPRQINLYSYGTLKDLTPIELYLCLLTEEAAKQFGTQDVVAVMSLILGYPFLSTRAKFRGATPGVSVASLICRELIDIRLKKAYLPAITGTIFSLKISWTNNVGAFVGRTIPEIGWMIGICDVVVISTKTTLRYNTIVKPEDRLNDATVGTLG
ncbi:hypothetical protein G3N58_30765 [Paraburkholderia sp. Ac-20342]|uniref:STM2901 family protein n=1 Tax=Paraburkholderia sp. Ac-20342 TaxID=2703889 RepID=UPI00198048C8|nr:hypothetical protein [Paraburkholderia sp. Ac-20342]MBN3851177.1 hypothetical protein [Paraburkholderia sp. Ac-20342]